MSINNIENIAFNYLTNLTTINADEVNTDILTKVDPDISDLQFDMLEGIHTDETIQEQIDAIEAEIAGLGSAYWLSAWDTTTQTNPVANTPRAMTWNSSDPASNGIVAGSATGSIKVLNTDTYNIQFSVEIKSSNSATTEITIWLRKNGSDVADTASEYDIKGNDFYTIGWNFVLPLLANDYVQLMWASSDTTMTLAYQSVQTSPYTHPAIPSVIITVTNVTSQGAQGPQGAIGPTGPQGERGPRGYKGEPGDGAVDDTARALAGSALALATVAEATAIAASASATAANAANAIQDITINSQGNSINNLQNKCQGFQYVTSTPNFGITPSYDFSVPIYVARFVDQTNPPPAVTLNDRNASFFYYGLTSSDLISTSDRFQSTSGTSYFNELEVGNISSLTDTVFIGRSNNASHKKLVLYDNNIVNAYDYKGIWVNIAGTPSGLADGFNFENTKDSAYHWFFGDGFGTDRFLSKKLTLTNESSYTASSTFLKQSGYSQQINMMRDIGANTVTMEFLGDSAGANAYDGEIIQGKGNGFNNNTGTMSIKSGQINIDAISAGINLTASLGTTTIQSNALVFNATSTGGITMTSDDPMNVTVNDEINISATSVTGKIKLSTTVSDIDIISKGSTNITPTNGNLNLITSDNTKDIIATSAQNVNITAANQLVLTSQNTGTTNSIIMNTAGDGTLADLTLSNTATANFKIRCPDNLDISTGSTRGLTLNSGSDGMTLTSIGAGAINLNAVSDISLTSSANDILLTSSDMTLQTTSGAVNIISKSGGGMTAQTNDLSLISTAGDVYLTATAAAINSVAGTSIQFQSGTTSAFNAGTSLALSSGTTLTATAGSNNDMTLTTTGSGDINLTSADLVNITASAGIQLKNQMYFNRTPTSSEYTTNNQAIGYTNSFNVGATYSGTASDTATLAQVGAFQLPARGAWFIQISVKITLNTGGDTIEDRTIVVSETAGSGVGGNIEISPGFKYADPINDGAGGSGERQNISFAGIYHWTATATKNIYINASVITTGSRTVTVSGNYKYTRIA